MELKDKGRPFWEHIIVGLLVGASVFISLGIYAKKDFLFKSEIVRLELLTLRNYAIAYILEYHQLPTSIEGAVGPWSMVPGPWSLKDPFGTPYLYNSKRGQVSSATRACKEW